MIACSWAGPRLHAQSFRLTSRKGWLPTLSMTVELGRGTRLRWRWNSPQRRWSEVKAKPAVAWVFPFGERSTDRDRARQESPRSMAAHDPRAATIDPLANADAGRKIPA